MQSVAVAGRVAESEAGESRPQQLPFPLQGIFGSPGLVRPADFPKAAADAQQRSQAIVAEILKPHAHRSSGKKAVHLLDDVSNTICLVADLVSAFVIYSTLAE